MGFTNFTVGIIITAVFAFAIINFAFLTSINNNANQTILDDPSFSGINDTLYNSLGGIQESAQTQREVFEQQEAQGGSSDEGFSLTAIVGIGKTFISTAIGSFNIILTIFFDVFGIPPVVLNVVLGAIIITVLILIWSVIKQGRT